MAMITGKLRHRVTIQTPTTVPGTHGGSYESWTDVATVWASVGPIRGNEWWDVQKSNSEITGRVTVRYRDGITASNRLLFKGRPLKILHILHPAERKEYLEIFYKEWQ